MTKNRPLNSWDMAKIVALLLMFVDHAGAYFLLDEQWLRAIGRGAAPVFLFLAGYAASYRFNWELLVLACLIVAPDIAMGEFPHTLNILFTILLVRAVLNGLEKRGKIIEKPWEWFVACAIFIAPTCFLLQYGTLGLMFAASGYMQRRPALYNQRTRTWFLLGTFAAYAVTFEFFFGLTPLNFLLMLPVLAFDYRLLTRLDIRAVDTHRMPRWLVRALTLASHYSAYVYALHLIVIAGVTRLPI